MTPRIAYTVEQCWHRVPGGTAIAAVETARALVADGSVDLVGVAARHRAQPAGDFAPPMSVTSLPLGSSRSLYAAWLWARRPRVERATGPVALTHSTTIVPAPTQSRLVVTVHDLAFLRYPEQFSRWGLTVLRRSLDLVRRHADLVLCSSLATLDDCTGAGIGLGQLRVVPLGVRAVDVDPSEVAAVRGRFALPERYALFVGTLEPRKNLARLVEAMGMLEERIPLAVAGPTGWGDTVVPDPARADVRVLGPVSVSERNALYSGAAVCCYPSTWEGFGLPVLEAMSAGTPVVTSRGISTEEVAGGAAVLVDPRDPADIARGMSDALRDTDALCLAGRARAATCTWERTAQLTIAAYRELVRW